MIWSFATNVPRIVHLETRRLRMDIELEWWEHVRSDKPIDGNDPEHYDNFEIDTQELLRIASRSERLQYTPRPQGLYGFRSESIPSVLLVCKESYSVASKVYSRAFASLGAFPQTYFNFELDTLYLDGRSLSNDIKPSMVYITGVMEAHFLECELALVRNLAIQWDFGSWFLDDDEGHEYGIEESADEDIVGVEPIEWLHTFERYFPNLQHFALVQQHFIRETGAQGVDIYRDLMCVDSTMEWRNNWTNPTYRINGYRVDDTIQRPRPCTSLCNRRWNAAAEKHWNEAYPERRPWQLPTPEFKCLMAASDEWHVVEEAHEFEKKYNKGRWYINPNDPNDFEDYPWDDIDDIWDGLDAGACQKGSEKPR